MKIPPAWALGFPELFTSMVNPQAVGGVCRQMGIRPRGTPKLSVHQLLMTLAGHALTATGSLGMQAFNLTGQKVSDAAISKRRQRLPWEIFERMMEWVLSPQADMKKHPQAFWKGYRLVGLDGTMFSVQNSCGILGRMVKAASRRAGSAFAKMRVVMLVELGTHHPMAAVIGKSSEGELTLARKLLGKIPEKTLLLADRLFGNGSFLADFLFLWAETERDFLVRVSKTPKSRALKRYADGSRLIEVRARVNGEWDAFQVREIYGSIQRGKGKITRVRLWTSLLSVKNFPAGELLELYGRRWEHELTFLELKKHLQGGPLLDSQTVETAMQELVSLIVAQAVIARIRMQAADGLDGQVLRISFAQVMAHTQSYWLWLMLMKRFITPDMGRAAAQTILQILVNTASPPRRTRSCPRAVRQPVSSWPRLLRRRDSTQNIHQHLI